MGRGFAFWCGVSVVVIGIPGSCACSTPGDHGDTPSGLLVTRDAAAILPEASLSEEAPGAPDLVSPIPSARPGLAGTIRVTTFAGLTLRAILPAQMGEVELLTLRDGVVLDSLMLHGVHSGCRLMGRAIRQLGPNTVLDVVVLTHWVKHDQPVFRPRGEVAYDDPTWRSAWRCARERVVTLSVIRMGQEGVLTQLARLDAPSSIGTREICEPGIVAARSRPKVAPDLSSIELVSEEFLDTDGDRWLYWDTELVQYEGGEYRAERRRDRVTRGARIAWMPSWHPCPSIPLLSGCATLEKRQREGR